MQTMTNPLYNKHVISISDLTRSDMELVVATAQRLKAEPDTRLLKDKLVASCFFEASTRTRLSFETAVQRLGGNIIGFADGGNTSAKKGETLADSIKIIGSVSTALFITHLLHARFAPPLGRRSSAMRLHSPCDLAQGGGWLDCQKRQCETAGQRLARRERYNALMDKG